MAPSKSASSPSSSSKSPPSTPALSMQSPHFIPIQECEREEEEAEDVRPTPTRRTHRTDGEPTPTHHHQPTPLHHSQKSGKPPSRKRQDSSSSSAAAGDDGNVSVSCNDCRPHVRENKISAVPLDSNNHHHHHGSNLRHSIPSPNGIFKSIVSSLTKRSPRSTAFDARSASAREEQWKVAVAELSHKLIHATRKRDEAVLEVSRLKHSMAELERKLNKLEIYCHTLKSGLDECSSNANNSPYRALRGHRQINLSSVNDKVIEHLLVSVSEARSSVRVLCRSLAMQLRTMIGGKVYERMSSLLQPYDVKVSLSKNPRTLLFHLEAILNRAFFEDFETVGFQKNSTNAILNPVERCDANLTSFNALCKLTWDEVLSKGTRYFSEEFSSFCDRKMSEIVGMLGWTRAWPEPLLQAFFGASKSVWLVHLLANSVHPGLPIYRVDKGARFDPTYMEDMGADKASKLVPTMVRIMVAPGFYIHGNVVKCKVLCRYYGRNHAGGNVDYDEKDSSSAPSPSP